MGPTIATFSRLLRKTGPKMSEPKLTRMEVLPYYREVADKFGPKSPRMLLEKEFGATWLWQIDPAEYPRVIEAMKSKLGR